MTYRVRFVGSNWDREEQKSILRQRQRKERKEERTRLAKLKGKGGLLVLASILDESLSDAVLDIFSSGEIYGEIVFTSMIEKAHIDTNATPRAQLNEFRNAWRNMRSADKLLYGDLFGAASFLFEERFVMVGNSLREKHTQKANTTNILKDDDYEVDAKEPPTKRSRTTTT